MAEQTKKTRVVDGDPMAEFRTWANQTAISVKQLQEEQQSITKKSRDAYADLSARMEKLGEAVTNAIVELKQQVELVATSAAAAANAAASRPALPQPGPATPASTFQLPEVPNLTSRWRGAPS